MKLFIVESPNKCAKIKSFLGADYNVMASVGHIREIPKKGMNIDIKGGTFEPTFQVSNDKKEVVKNLKEAAKKASEIYLATDFDREGEAISWHIYDILDNNSKKKCKRVTFTEITKKAIEDALANPRDIDSSLVAAAKARQVLDRLVGYKISPVLWYIPKISSSSAGRVQSISLKLVCDRQKEINAFKPEDYWFVEVLLKCKNGEFWAKVITKEKENKYLNEKVAQDDLEKLQKASYILDKVERAEKKNNPYPPFDTNSLQVTCSNIFGWSLSKSQTIAQKLYEQGKCFLPGTKIVMTSGEILDIRDVKNMPSDWSKEILSLDTNLSSVVVKANPVVLPHKGKINIIKTSSDIIRVTDDHIFPVFDCEKGEIIEKRASDIKEQTDYFVVKQEDIRNKIKNRKYSIIELLALSNKNHDKFLVRFSKGFLWGITGIKSIRKLLIFDCKIKYFTVDKYLRTDTLPFSALQYLINKNIISLDCIEKNYKCLQFASPSSKPIRLPFWLDERICYVAGLAASDGHLINSKIMLKSLLDKNPNGIDIEKYVDIRKVINDFMSGFGMESSKKLNFSNNILVEILNIIGVPCGKKSSLIDISNIILTSGSNNVMAYIAGLFDGDGYFTFNKIKGSNVSIQAGYTSMSHKLIYKLRIVLSQFGINTEIHEDPRTHAQTLKISIYDVDKFANLIASFSKIKIEVYRSIFINRNHRSNSRSPHNKPFIKVLESERQKNGITKEQLSILSGFDYWNYYSKGKDVPQAACEKIADILSSELIRKLSSVSYEKIISNKQEDYDGDVYCFQTSNKYFLVENGILTHNCTYIRTDSFNISEEALKELRDHIKERYSKEYLSSQPNVYTKKSSAAAQEAHESIRPIHIKDTGDDIEDAAEKKMYSLIRDRFLACQMSQMVVDTVSYDVKASTNHHLIARGQTIKFDGWSKVYKYSKTKEEVLPVAQEKENLDLKEIKKTKHTTQPPARYNEGSLAKMMEKEGVGRPSTRASIITSIQKKGYVEKEKKGKGLIATILGLKICDYLEPNFKDFFMNVKYTSTLEEDLDEIAAGKKTYLEVVSAVYKVLQEHIKACEDNPANKKEVKSMGKKCMVCKEGEIIERDGKYGKFYACDKFPSCKTVYAMGEDGEFSIKEKKIVKSSGRKCPECQKAGRDGELIERKNKSNGSGFWGCSKYPQCRHSEPIDGESGSTKKTYAKKAVEKEEETPDEVLDLSIDGDEI